MKLAAALLITLPAISLAQQVAIGEYNLYTQTVPINIVVGPDNAMWFTGLGNSASGSVVGRMSPSGQFTEWNVEYTAYRYAITPGPDGALWFTEGSTGNIGRITTAGQITQFPLPTKYTTTFGIAAGPDGALWFTEGIAGKIGRMTTAGVVTEYALSNATNPGFITAGPDGALWFSYLSNNAFQIGRMTTAGAFTIYPAPGGQEVYQIISGPDGALWFADGVGIGRMTTSGEGTVYPLTDGANFTQGITVGPDGALWFTEETGNNIGRITTKGKMTEYPIATPGSNPIGIAAGPNGTLWFAEYSGNKIGEAFLVTANLLANPASGYYRSTITFTGSEFGPNENVVIYKDGIGSGVLASATADATGAFTTTGPAPQSAYGHRIFVGVGQTSGKLGAANFAITPRVILAPDSGTPGSSTTVAGYGFSAYESVALYWNNPRTPLGTVVADIYGNVTFGITVPLGAPVGKNGVFGRGESTSAIGPGSFMVQ